MQFKDKLKKLRTEKGISQQALADSIYVSRSAIAKWENGFGYPSQDSYDALVAYFGVTEDYFLTEAPEAIIVGKNRHIRVLYYILAAAAIFVVMLAAVGGYHWFSSVPQTNIEGMRKQATEYLGYDEVQIIKAAQRGDYLAALCVTQDNNWCLCVFDRDSLFGDRWRANGGVRSLSAGKLGSWNYGSSAGEAVLVFCGGGLPDEIKWYAFTNSGIEYTCPVKENTVLDIFIIPDSFNINGSPVPLNGEKQPLS